MVVSADINDVYSASYDMYFFHVIGQDKKERESINRSKLTLVRVETSLMIPLALSELLRLRVHHYHTVSSPALSTERTLRKFTFTDEPV